MIRFARKSKFQFLFFSFLTIGLFAGGISVIQERNIVPEEVDLPVHQTTAVKAAQFLDKRFGSLNNGTAADMGLGFVAGYGNDVHNGITTVEDRDYLLMVSTYPSSCLKENNTNGKCDCEQTFAATGETVPCRYPKWGSDGKPAFGLFDDLHIVAERHPGGYYMIGNEPDGTAPGGAFIPPPVYAKWYKDFADEILKHDPTAKIAPGGLFYVNADYDGREYSMDGDSCNYQAGSDWKVCEADIYLWKDVETPSNNKKTSPRIPALLNAMDDPEDEEIIKNNSWAYLFVKDLLDLYQADSPGFQIEDLPIHWWNIHPYPREYEENGDLDSVKVEDAVSETIDAVDNFNQFLHLIGHQDRPLIATEVGIAHPPDFCRCGIGAGCENPIKQPLTNNYSDVVCLTQDDENEFEENYERNFQQFMPDVLEYFATSGKLHRWIWFYTHEPTYVENGQTIKGWPDMPSALFRYANGNWSELAQKYIDLASNYEDTSPPVISSVTAQFDTYVGSDKSKLKYNVSISATDGTITQPEVSGVTEYHYKLTDSSGKLIQEGFDASVLGTHQIVVETPATSTTSKLSLQVKDNAGNLSDPTVVYLSNFGTSLKTESSPSSFSKSLGAGVNLISIPTVMEGSGTSNVGSAKKLIELLESQGVEMSTIATYRNKFHVLGKSSDGYIGEDFQITPFDGLFLITKSVDSMSANGFKVKGAMQISLKSGWNFIPIINTDEELDADSVLTSINQLEGVTADIITRWGSGTYSNYSIIGSDKFGSNFTIDNTSSYWVRVVEGSGVFTP